MAWWILLALVVTVLALGAWPGRRRYPPCLVVTLDAQASVEGVLRRAAGQGRAVYVWDLGSRDATRAIVDRLSEELSGLYVVEGGLLDVLKRCGVPSCELIPVLGQRGALPPLPERGGSRRSGPRGETWR